MWSHYGAGKWEERGEGLVIKEMEKNYQSGGNKGSRN